jgi:hypothetical protein
MFATMLVWVKIQFDWKKKNSKIKKKLETRAKRKSEKMP